MSAIKVILYKQKTLANNEHPVMLYLFEEKVYRLSLGMSCSLKDWDNKKNQFRRTVSNYKSKNLTLRKYELQAKDIIDDFVREGKYFDFDIFKKLFKGEKTKVFFYAFFQQMIDEKEQLGKHGTMLTYRNGLSALKRSQSRDVLFESINYSFLKQVETYLLSNGCSGSGVNVYMRTIRAVYYEGVRRGFVDKDCNPFATATNKNGYSISKLKTRRNPKALTLAELERFKAFKNELHKYPHLSNSWYYFMFSYYLYGINFIDMCQLKTKNINESRLCYVRQKTGKEFNLMINECAQQILDHFKGQMDESGYLLPILNSFHKTDIQKRNRRLKIMKEANLGLKEMGIRLNIKTPLTFYVARHTAATTMKRKGVSTDVISEALGHKTLDVTQSYLKKFDNHVIDEAMSVL